jgi:signal transduction histidine kinase/CheY-like chemotaxis protein
MGLLMKRATWVISLLLLPAQLFCQSVTHAEFEDFFEKIKRLKSDSLEKAVSLVDEFHGIALNQDNPDLLSKSFYLLGFVHLDNEFQKSRDYFDQSLIHLQNLEDTTLKTDVFFHKGLIEYYLGNSRNAVRFFHRSLDGYLQNGKKQETANVFQNLGMVYSGRNDTVAALDYYLKSLNINNQLNNNVNSASVSHNIGVIYSNQGKLDKALEYYKNSLTNFQKAGFKEGVATVINNIGVLYEKQKSYRDALASYQKALQLFKELQNNHLIIYGHFNMGKAYTGLKDYDNALFHFNKCIDLSIELSATDFLTEAYASISGIYEQKAEYKKSLAFYQKFKVLEDSLHNTETQARLTEIQSQYNNELTAKELALQTKKLNRKTLILYIFITGAFFFLVVIVLLYFENRQKLKAQKELMQHRDHLEEMVKNKTEALKIEINERKIAEESEKLKSAFLANMSHEIRTPMNSILAFSNFLKDNSLTIEKREEYIHYINTCGRNLLQIINDILDIAKLEAKQLHIKKEPCNLSQLLKETYQIMKEGKSPELEGDVSFRLSPQYLHENLIIETDYNRLRQVITNLIDNAFKYTQKGYIEFGIQKIKGNLIFFYVKDTGTGIPLNKTRAIFERFHQSEVDLHKKVGGNGLGLAICKNLTELLGGKIWVVSKMGHGSIFNFTLPFTMAKNERIHKKHKLEMSKKEIKYQWEDKTILVAEDEDLNYKIIEIALRPTKAKVKRVKNGNEAIDYCESNNVDLVLMDIQMPILDGYKATRSIKSSKPQIPIIAQTSFAMDEDKKKCFDAGCNDFITKPINIQEMYLKINKHLEIKTHHKVND